MPGVTLIVAGGDRPERVVLDALPEIDFCIAADGGADYALAAGLTVDSVVGDLDSISADGLAMLREAGVEIREYASAKDQTDLELAFERAAELEPDRIVVIGIGGGRLDHALANVAVLTAGARDGAVEVDAYVGSSRLSVINGSRTLAGALGETISLLAVLGGVEGVTTEGLEYPLLDEPLAAGSARGVSNRFVAPLATVSVGSGTLLAVQPFALRDRGRT
jgi:thiamine pyrophosphokinase